MAFWKDREGKEVTVKEFGQRWKQGVMQISPMQLLQYSQYGYYIVLIGILLGIYICYLNKQWWLIVILFGSLFTTGTATIANFQKLKAFKDMEAALKNVAVPENKGYIN